MANTNNEKRGLAARILGGQPTPVQKVVFWLIHKRDGSFCVCKTMNCIAQAVCRQKDDWWK